MALQASFSDSALACAVSCVQFLFATNSGRCTSCPGANFTWQEVVDMRAQSLRVPSYRGAMFGHHLAQQFVLPIGGLVELDASAGTITMLESAVL